MAACRALPVVWPWASFQTRLKYDAFHHPNYAYGVYHAARQAAALGVPHISVIEFGVAAGRGLRALEGMAGQVEGLTSVQISVFGFDTLSGMPASEDHRDLPYVWSSGLFSPHVDVQRTLVRATLIQGNVRETAADFCSASPLPPPIGFVSFDLDYYSSTRDAMRVLAASTELLLPRVFCYFDDCVGDDHELHSEFAGELAAITEFNQTQERRKIAPIFGLRHKRMIHAPWNDTMCVLHAFDHPDYCRYTNPRWRGADQPTL